MIALLRSCGLVNWRSSYGCHCFAVARHRRHRLDGIDADRINELSPFGSNRPRLYVGQYRPPRPCR